MTNPMALHENFCQNLRKRRRELHLTQLELAEKLGVSRPYIAEVEAGKSIPSLETVERFAKALDCPPVTLLVIEDAVAAQ
jgi:transcriptional regulator with XRE-family HTH domain